MSAAMAVGDVLELTFSGRLMSQVILTVLHVRITTAPSGGSTAEAQLDDWVGWFSNKVTNNWLQKYLDAAAANFTVFECKLQKVYPTRTIFASSIIAETGQQTEDALQSNLAASIEKKTTTVGRKGVGRMQFAPLPKDAYAGGFVDPGFAATPLTGLANAMIGSINCGITYTGSARYCLPAAAGGGAAYDLYDAYPKETVRTMHRRTVGLGI